MKKRRKIVQTSSTLCSARLLLPRPYAQSINDAALFSLFLLGHLPPHLLSVSCLAGEELSVCVRNIYIVPNPGI